MPAKKSAVGAAQSLLFIRAPLRCARACGAWKDHFLITLRGPEGPLFHPPAKSQKVLKRWLFRSDGM